MAPATAREIATDLVVTEAAVKQHLLRLYQKFRIAEGQNRRTRLANEVVALGLVRPLPPPGRAGPAATGTAAAGAAARRARHPPGGPSSRMDRRGGTHLPRGTPNTNGSPTARRASARAAGPIAIP